MKNKVLNDISGKLLPHDDFKSFMLMSFETLYPNVEFNDSWHIDFLGEALDGVEQSKIKRLLVNVPPRSLKSTIISVIWPAWLLAMNPRKRIIVASYAQGLSTKLSMETRLILNSEWFHRLYPKTIIALGCNQKNKFITTQNGFRFATSIGGTLTGDGADILIVDDPHTPLQAASKKKREMALEWYDQTFSTRLNDKKLGAIVVIMQRLHPKDLSAHLMDKKVWKHLKLKSISEEEEVLSVSKLKYYRKTGELLIPNRDGIREIMRTKQEVGSYAFYSQYQQNPVPIDSGFIKKSWMNYYDKVPIAESGIIVQSWDCAIKTGEKNDYSVCTTWMVEEERFFLLDVFRQKCEYHDLKAKIIAKYREFNPCAVLIEDKASGQSLIQELSKMQGIIVVPCNPKLSKDLRTLSVLGIFESGSVILPKHANWLTELEGELFTFPNAIHDDQIDSITQFLQWYKSRPLTAKKSVLRIL